MPTSYSNLELTRERFERGGVLVGDLPVVTPIIPFGQNVRGKSFFEDAIASEWRKSVAAIIQTGKLLSQAKDELDSDVFAALKVPFKPRVSQMLRRIAGHLILSEPANTCSLHASWRVLYELTKVPDPVLRAALADGRIHPALTMKDVRLLRGLPPTPEHLGNQEPETNGQAALPEAVALWTAFSPADKRAILDHEGRTGLAKLLSPKLVGDLVDHLLGQQTFGATTESKRANALTAILRNALTVDDSMQRMKAKLQSLNLTVNDISIALPGKRTGRGK